VHAGWRRCPLLLGVRTVPPVRRNEGFSEASAVFSQESLRSPTTSPSVSHLAPTPCGQRFARIRSDLASAIGEKTDPLKVAPWPRTHPEDMTGSNLGHLDIARGSRSRCAVPAEYEEDGGAQSGAHTVVRKGRTDHGGKVSSRIAWRSHQPTSGRRRSGWPHRYSITNIGGYRSKHDIYSQAGRAASQLGAFRDREPWNLGEDSESLVAPHRDTPMREVEMAAGS
jgi:hypothetical protein